jgi:hypothetical protein
MAAASSRRKYCYIYPQLTRNPANPTTPPIQINATYQRLTMQQYFFLLSVDSKIEKDCTICAAEQALSPKHISSHFQAMNAPEDDLSETHP